MKKSTVSALIVLASSVAASAALTPFNVNVLLV